MYLGLGIKRSLQIVDDKYRLMAVHCTIHSLSNSRMCASLVYPLKIIYIIVILQGGAYVFGRFLKVGVASK